MTVEELFARRVRDLCALILDAGGLTLDVRITRTWQALGAVSSLAAALPVLPAALPAFGPSPLDGWPGVGTFEDYWRETDAGPVPMRVTDTLTFVFQQLWAGLEVWEAGELERAVGIWGLGFESSWGPAAAEVLDVLRPAVVGYRTDARSRFRKKRRATSPLVMVGGGGSPRAPVDDRPTLGVRIEPVEGGVQVLAVHPAGPARGSLVPGDVVLSVDGRSLAGLGRDDAGAALTGPIGTSRRYEVWSDGETRFVDLASVPVTRLG